MSNGRAKIRKKLCTDRPSCTDMEISSSKNAVTEYVENQRKNGKTVGFVPTMGALHEGHISLIARSRSQCDVTLASIFVNPTQFNQAEDLEKYPRTEEADAAMLREAGCDMLFLPTVEEIYPGGAQVTRTWDFGTLTELMEGAHRPGHFEGVAQVVYLLLDITKPDVLFLGQKDYQQFAILQKMASLEGLRTRVEACAIIREEDGLAMSSRNRRLSDSARKDAVALSQILFYARGASEELPLQTVKGTALKMLEDNPHLEPEYFEIADPQTLLALKEWPKSGQAVICTAAWIEGIRLIDNVLVNFG